MFSANDLSKECALVYPDGVDPSAGMRVCNDIGHPKRGKVLEAFKDGKVTVDRLLDNIDLELKWYRPSDFAWKFMTFIRMVLGENPENSNPIAHYFFIDCVFQQPNVEPFFLIRGISYQEMKDRIVILASREFSKSTLMCYIFLWMADNGSIPGFGKVNYGIYVSDSMKNGVENTMKTIQKVYMESEYLRGRFEETRLIQTEVNFIRHPRTKKEIDAYNKAVNIDKLKPDQVPGRMKRTFTLAGIGAAALPLDEVVYTDNGTTTIGELVVGDKIYGPDGDLTTVTYKSEIYNKPIYKMTLKDNRVLVMCEDHINPIEIKNPNKHPVQYECKNVTAKELSSIKIFRNRKNRSGNEYTHYIRNIEPVKYSPKDLLIDPYTLGLLLGDGSMKKQDGGTYLHSHKDDIQTYIDNIPYKTGKPYRDKRNNNVDTISIHGVVGDIVKMNLDVICHNKFIPETYQYGSIDQRLSLLQGLMDTDGTVYGKYGRMVYNTISYTLACDVEKLVRSLGGTAKINSREQVSDLGVASMMYKVEFSLNMQCFRLKRKLERQKFNRFSSDRVAITNIELLDYVVPTQCISVDNDEHQFVTSHSYIRTHNTGGRGSRDALARPDFVIFDDLLPSEKDANSETILAAAESTIEADMLPGMNNNANFSIMIGTPYSKKDTVYRRVELGTWLPIVFPRGNMLPENEDEFISVWPDRHSYKKCRRDYNMAIKTKEAGDSSVMRRLMQEHYLRISSDEDKLVPENLFQWYNRSNIMNHADEFNWYMTTDFTTTGNDGSDLSGAALWAMGSDNNIFLVDLQLKRLELEEQYQGVLDMIRRYSGYIRMIEVGVELDGGQRTHILALQDRMIRQNVLFTFARQRGKKIGDIGIMSRLEGGNKHWRFRMAVPYFQNRKIWFPNELKENPDFIELLEEIKYATYRGFGTKHDDGGDLISMLAMMEITYPVIGATVNNDNVKMRSQDEINQDRFWGRVQTDERDMGAYASYAT